MQKTEELKQINRQIEELLNEMSYLSLLVTGKDIENERRLKQLQAKKADLEKELWQKEIE